jgi:molybdopterin adenylyltransferase
MKENTMIRVKAISISDRKGMRKKNIESAVLIAGHGLEQDAHAGKWHRQVSFLAEESIESMRQKGLKVVAGNFAENITTAGIDLTRLPVGAHLRMGATELIISQLGKVCHNPCAIFHQAGDCVMPREGIFGVVIRGGAIQVGDEIEVLATRSSSAAIILSKENEKKYGLRLHELVMSGLRPGFVRFDQLNDKEDNAQTILADLIDTQHVDRIILFDPPGTHSLALAGRNPAGHPQLCHCRSLADVRNLQGINEEDR